MDPVCLSVCLSVCYGMGFYRRWETSLGGNEWHGTGRDQQNRKMAGAFVFGTLVHRWRLRVRSVVEDGYGTRM